MGRSAPFRSDGASGALLEHTDRRTGSVAVNDALLGLHEGLFASPVLRWLYFASGLIGTAMIATGLVLWTVKRRRSDRRHAGLELVERLNVGTIVGLPVAIAAYFWANRLIPIDVADRAAREMDALFIVWLVMLAYAAVRPPRRAWIEQSALASLAFGLLPVLNAATSNLGLGRSLPAGEWALAGFDLTAIAAGLGFLAASWQLRRALESSERDSSTRPAQPSSRPLAAPASRPGR